MKPTLVVIPFLLLATCTSQVYASCETDQYEFMLKCDTPTNGPENQPYQPGSPGASWTEEEVSSTRDRIKQMIDPSHKFKQKAFGATKNGKPDGNFITGEITEDKIVRLIFHDCIPYFDGSGGCDGCLNWNSMWKNNASNVPDLDADGLALTNNGKLDGVAQGLELIYKTIDWPLKKQSLKFSLYQTGKSRADLWQLAGLVALEQTFERANRACDLDFHARQQVCIY